MALVRNHLFKMHRSAFKRSPLYFDLIEQAKCKSEDRFGVHSRAIQLSRTALKNDGPQLKLMQALDNTINLLLPTNCRKTFSRRIKRIQWLLRVFLKFAYKG